MSRRVLLRLLARLDRSPLPLRDRVRIELERELLDLLCPPPTTREPPRRVIVVDPDAFGDHDTSVPG